MTFPQKFEALESFKEWAIPTPDGRQHKRLSSTSEGLKAFYEAMVPHLDAILEDCNQYRLGELPEDHQTLFNMTLSLAEVAPHIELYRGQVGVPFSFEEKRLLADHGDDQTWKAQAPNRRRPAH